LSAVAADIKATTGTRASEQRSETADRVSATRFFALAIAVVNIDALWLLRSTVLPNWLALIALFAAVVGLCLPPLGRRAPAIARYLPTPSMCSFLAVFSAFLAFYSATTSLEATGFNEPVRQSYAYLHGRAWA
jgi:hypothetical protein